MGYGASLKMKKIAIALALVVAIPAAAGPSGGSGRSIGSAIAPITIELFSDFECPACKTLHDETLGPLIADYVDKGKVYLVRRYWAWPQHAHAKVAACLASAAERIGKYQPVCDALFKDQQAWSISGKVEEAASSVLTPAEAQKVRALAKDPAVIAEVDKDMALGKAENVTQTPTMIITHNGQKTPIPGPISYPILKRFLDNLLAH